MIQFTVSIKIPTWGDFKKWFWDKIAYPRRRDCALWVTYFSDTVREDIADYLYDKMDGEQFKEAVAAIDEARKKRAKETIRLMSKP